MKKGKILLFVITIVAIGFAISGCTSDELSGEWCDTANPNEKISIENDIALIYSTEDGFARVCDVDREKQTLTTRDSSNDHDVIAYEINKNQLVLTSDNRYDGVYERDKDAPKGKSNLNGDWLQASAASEKLSIDGDKAVFYSTDDTWSAVYSIKEQTLNYIGKGDANDKSENRAEFFVVNGKIGVTSEIRVDGVYIPDKDIEAANGDKGLDGDWLMAGETSEKVTVNGASALFKSDDGWSMLYLMNDGKLEPKKDDPDSWYDLTGEYYLINGKLVVASEIRIDGVYSRKGIKANGSVKTNEDIKDEKNYKYVGDDEEIELGEYIVGVDVKPGAYNVQFFYYNLDSDEEENEVGEVSFFKDGSLVKTTEFEDYDEERIIFEEGQIVKFSSKGKDSHFVLNAE